MTKYREILWLKSQGVSSRIIAESLKCSRNTIKRVTEKAEEKGISWPLADNITDRQLEQQLFGTPTRVRQRKMPDFEYIHQEMARNGVTSDFSPQPALERVLRKLQDGRQPPSYVQPVLLPLS